MDKTRIIVVEDNIVYCEFVCNLLAREGFRTVQAYHLSTAKKLLQQASDGDIVVSDLRLPDGDGIDLLRWMRKEGMTQPLIIMTNYAEVHTAVESMKLGSLDYIPKQLVEDKLMPLLHTILKERSIGRNRMPVFARDSSAFQKIMQLSRPEKGLQKRVNLMQQTTNSDLSRHYLPRQLRHLILQEYLSGVKTARQLSEEHGIPMSTIHKMGQRWKAKNSCSF
ncbi:response regulator, partial [Alistipes onderdonkii]|uniref:response regulator n=4 Tax=Alistipes TaxID=239759 RepID=UPI001E5FF743